MNDRKMERTLLELFEDIAGDEDVQADLGQPALANARRPGWRRNGRAIPDPRTE